MVSSVIAAAATGIGTLWVVNILGALLAIFPRRKDAAKSGLLTHNGLLVISKLSTLVLLPTLMGTSVAKTLDLEALQTAWPMLIWHVVATLLCVGIASVIAWVTGRPASIRKMFIVGSAFGNASDMALFVMSYYYSLIARSFARNPTCKALSSVWIAVLRTLGSVRFPCSFCSGPLVQPCYNLHRTS
eukprot:m.291958 g.291958  ORF g.291958 m.291958 type:complete len:187 (+) comp15831_c0_seq2:270-830(+)